MPRVSVILYCPALSVVVCVTCWKLDRPDSSRQSTTSTPDGGGLLVSPPEITTFRPAVDGSGEAAIVNAPDVHGVVQQALVQQFVAEQHVLDCAQQVAVGLGSTGRPGRDRVESAGVGSRNEQCPRARLRGQRDAASSATAPAGQSIATTHNEATSDRSDDGTIKRRIAENRDTAYPDL